MNKIGRAPAWWVAELASAGAPLDMTSPLRDHLGMDTRQPPSPDAIRIATEAVKARRQQDKINFMKQILDPQRAPLLAPAMNALRDRLLSLGPDEWLSYPEAIALGIGASPVAVKTVDGRIRDLIAMGAIERRGKYNRKWDKASKKFDVDDKREIRLIDWPGPAAS